MYYIMHIYKAISVKGPFVTLADAEKILAQLNELVDDGWIIVKSA